MRGVSPCVDERKSEALPWPGRLAKLANHCANLKVSREPLASFETPVLHVPLISLILSGRTRWASTNEWIWAYAMYVYSTSLCSWDI